MSIQPASGRLDTARIEQTHHAGYWHDEVVTDLLAKHAKDQPDAIAIVDGEHRLSWSRFYQLSQRFAIHLRELGVEPGDFIALQMPNWMEYLVCYHGIRLAGGVVVQVGAGPSLGVETPEAAEQTFQKVRQVRRQIQAERRPAPVRPPETKQLQSTQETDSAQDQDKLIDLEA